ncbi:hypothetical protein RhiirC2_790578 [Rhizophagus irregularis]|uniref:Uncharacterized protein n=1 Tax=Rhizophagus irregularis TaxID=588596 RepID=A0A2N1ML00_9GLOM|nr:hypothetical protein RhiirC2_790578 [Rhizophagus irregularis]
MIYLHGYFYILTGENPDGSGTPSWNWNFGLKISASGYWISASRVLWDIGFRLPGFFEILDFGFLGSLGYWISAFRVLLNSFFTGIGSRIGYMGFEGPRRDWIPISKVQDAHLETLTLTSGLRIWIQNFFFVDLFNYGFGFEFSFCRCSEFSADWNFFILDLNLDFLWVRQIWNNWTCFFRTDLNLVSNDHSSGSMNLG